MKRNHNTLTVPFEKSETFFFSEMKYILALFALVSFPVKLIC